ncbi:hypothetical protein CFIMG_003463RAa [Ceratocystis fimbriata CBS 114723]|uniref:Cyclin-dependent kinase n=1 Tax=Ceratocystis fimbriata CBS 114723 TaxID=1035309 RepID=A0A2C5XKL4_9PEZI|nr:hypothetical protein CFIMG_003463RAa [Ceratocystis fimbriata CBS 114723]
MPLSNIAAIAAAAAVVSTPSSLDSPLFSPSRQQSPISKLRSRISPSNSCPPHSDTASHSLPSLCPHANDHPSSSFSPLSSCPRIPSLRPGISSPPPLLLTPPSSASSSFASSTSVPVKDAGVLAATTDSTTTFPSTAAARAPTTHKYPARPSLGSSAPTSILTPARSGPAFPSPYTCTSSRRLLPDTTTATSDIIATQSGRIANAYLPNTSRPQKRTCVDAHLTATTATAVGPVAGADCAVVPHSHRHGLPHAHSSAPLHARVVNRVDSTSTSTSIATTNLTTMNTSSSSTEPAHVAVALQQTQSPPARAPQSHSHSPSHSPSRSQSASRTTLPDTTLATAAIDTQSQLLQLSHLAVLQNKMVEIASPPDPGSASLSRKRTADGVVKHDVSLPKRLGHSRNTSAVSASSASGSKIGELSAELRTRLSYAMVKVSHGWQFHSIDEVESLASKAVSPSSSSSTHLRRPALSTSPGLSSTDKSVIESTTTPASFDAHSQPSPPLSKSSSTIQNSNSSNDNGLAPPVSIQSSRPATQQHSRCSSRPTYTPTLLSHSQSMPPRTPASAAPTHRRRQSCTQVGSISGGEGSSSMVFSPHQNVREQDAIESLLFMSSPGNSANLKNSYTGSLASPLTQSGLRHLPFSSSAPAESTSSSQRHALPDSQPRKNLSSRKLAAANSLDDADCETDASGSLLDMSVGTRGTLRRRVGLSGSYIAGPGYGPGSSHTNLHLQLPSALDTPMRTQTRLADEDIDRMLERVAAEDSEDDDDEIQIPQRIMVTPHVQAV